MKQVSSFEAKNQLSALLDLAERGETVLITRHGRAVARLVPVGDYKRHKDAALAAERIRARARGLNLGPFDWSEWKAYRDERAALSLVSE